MHSNKSDGFHVVEAVLVVALIALLGFVGYRVWQARQTAPKKPTSSQATQVPAVKTSKDLDTAASFINQVDTSSDTGDLTKMQQELDTL